ncbi:MAG TPA: hypothetical protein VN256_05230 [Pyrinomonadaceae bacterium]|nr:hypothetical protein [Pyrinomonadaceae bacterium]
MLLTQIVPRLPPMIDGVGDYALGLARGLRDGFQVETRFVVTDAAWDGGDRVEGFGVSRLGGRSVEELLGALPRGETASALVHYGGYAYAKRGCPAWLVRALGHWREEAGGRRLLTFFHELYAAGPPWTSSFWLSRRQRSLAARLARASDESLTSLGLYASRLRWMGARGAESLPVFSSVGEPATTAPLASRRRRLVVFGTRGRRAEVYRRSAGELNRVCRRLKIEEVWDIGREADSPAARLLDVPVIYCGETTAREVSEILLDSVAGVIDYPADMLGKSTIFAAYCAHRVLPLVANRGQGGEADNLRAGTHYRLVEDSERLGLDAAQRLADAAFDWYQTHTLSVHAGRLANRLRRSGLPAEENLAYA